jgi:hypothetical protein
MIQSIGHISRDVALTWALSVTVLIGGFAATSRWFDSTHNALAATAETATLQIAANEKVLRTKPKLVADEHTVDGLLSHVDLEGDDVSTVAQFLRELDRASRARDVRFVSVLSGGAGRNAATSTTPSGIRSTRVTSETSVEFFAALPLEVVIEGRFTDIISLIRSLANDRMLVKTEVRSIVHASGRPSGAPRLTTGLSITLYHRAPPTAGVLHASP